MSRVFRPLVLILSVLSWASLGYGWSCPTHELIAQEAGMANPRYACIADTSRNENYDLLVAFHFHNAAPIVRVTPAYVDAYTVEKHSVKLYGDTVKPSTVLVPHKAGVLYWKIVSLYQLMKQPKYPGDYEYALMNIAHFIGDLSQPLHNFPHGIDPASDGTVYEKEGGWSLEKHAEFDDRLDPPALTNEDREYLRGKVAPMTITGVEDLKQKIADLANRSIALANACYADGKRVMTKQEALGQVALSVSLLKAVIASTGQ
jgi:hypothetical protein